jgi:Cof subfamily protein (haloacid dehalogenase superfamily)
VQQINHILSLDLDSTILDRNKQCPKELIAIIDMLTHNGVGILINSGRPWHSIVNLIRPLFGQENWISAFTGGLVTDNNDRMVKSVFLNGNIVERLLSTICSKDVNVVLFNDDIIYCNTYSDIILKYAQILELKFVEDPDLINQIPIYLWRALAFRFQADSAEAVKDKCKAISDKQFKMFNTVPTLLDVIPLNSGKDLALKAMADVYSIDLTDCYAIGDGENDLPMLLSAGHGGLVGNQKISLIPDTVKVAQAEYGYGVIELLKNWDLC